VEAAVLGEYTLLSLAAVVGVILLEWGWLRTGLLREPRYWGTVAIALGFQILVDGWLTRADATIVYYNDAQTSGVRWPWHIPIEDFAFGFALITLTLLVWRRLARRADDA
jgi:lycopene cyclase domain-containing protein